MSRIHAILLLQKKTVPPKKINPPDPRHARHVERVPHIERGGGALTRRAMDVEKMKPRLDPQAIRRQSCKACKLEIF
jgi:hypothetical protein